MAQVADFYFGIYRLTWTKKGSTHEATVKFDDGSGERRYGLKVYGKEKTKEAATALISWVENREAKELKLAGSKTSDVWAAYYAEKEKDGAHVIKVKTYWGRLKPYFGNTDITAITEAACQKYAVDKEAEGYAEWTIYCDLNHLRTICNWAVKKKIITDKQCPLIWLPQEPSAAVTQAMTLDQVTALLDATPTDHMRLFILLAIGTAGRLTALLELTWDRVDFVKNEIDLRLKKERKSILDKSFQKGRAVVSMNETTRTALLHAYQTRTGDESHVIQWKGAPVKSVKTAFNRAVERAKLPEWVTPHVLRHSTATIMDASGVPVEEISKFLGHSDVDVTKRIYIKKSGGGLVNAASKVELAPPKMRVVK